MTILNVYLEPNRALVVSNTQGVQHDGAHTNIAKILAIPHANAVVAGRGLLRLWFSLYAECYGTMGDVDALVEFLPGAAERHRSALRSEKDQAGVNMSLDTHVVLIGWSAKRKQMTAHLLHVPEHGEIHMTETPDGMLSPADARWELSADAPSDISGMIGYAKEQARHAELDYPRQGWLGDLTIAQLTQESITFTSVADFWR